MKRVAAAVGVLLVSGSSAVAEQAAIPRNPQIEIAYVAPRNARHERYYKRMQQLQVLETLQQFLAPLKLNRKLSIKTDDCDGALTLPYRPQEPVTLCYEYIRSVYVNAPVEGVVFFGRGRRMTARQAIAGAIVQLALHQVAVATFDNLEIPVWGTISDAADNVAGFIMIEFGEDVAWTTLMGTAWYLAQRGIMGTGLFTDAARPIDAQRFYNYLCIAYGARPRRYAFLVNNFNLPSGRARFCRQDYLKLRASFRKVIMPHVDIELLGKVRGRKWIPY